MGRFQNPRVLREGLRNGWNDEAGLKYTKIKQHNPVSNIQKLEAFVIAFHYCLKKKHESNMLSKVEK